MLERGSAARTTAAHKMNSESSRSHAIVTLTLEQHARRDAAGSLPHVSIVGAPGNIPHVSEVNYPELVC